MTARKPLLRLKYPSAAAEKRFQSDLAGINLLINAISKILRGCKTLDAGQRSWLKSRYETLVIERKIMITNFRRVPND
jgi:hypothetical protein